MERIPRDSKTYPDTDFTKPIDIKQLMSKSVDCFGRAWNITTSECSQCADKDICGIVFRATVDSEAKKLEKDNGVKFLDRTEFRDIDGDSVEEWIVSGETTVKDLLNHVAELAETDETGAVVHWIKQFVKGRKSVYTSNGLVWKR